MHNDLARLGVRDRHLLTPFSFGGAAGYSSSFCGESAGLGAAETPSTGPKTSSMRKSSGQSRLGA